MGWGDWSRTGAPAHTPHLETMSRSEGAVWFHRAYAGNPICSPTRASVLVSEPHDPDIPRLNHWSLSRSAPPLLCKYICV